MVQAAIDSRCENVLIDGNGGHFEQKGKSIQEKM